jgi:serine/threonine-protein kinase
VTAPSPAERLARAVAAQYRIERELGQGGMATVYLAHDLKHDRKVALKVLRPELAAVIGAERFLSEIRTTANLQHPHILPLHDSGNADGFLYYVMPFVEGESLRDRLVREKQLPIPDAIAIAGEVGGALDYAHRHGVIHRDIKPENILLHDGRALVADFGIALAASKAGDTRMTETGMSLGTPHYMSPEQAMGEREITPRSDIYALGAVVYEMLCGEPPFSGPTAQAIVAKVLTEAPSRLVPRRHTVPLEVEDAVLTALEKLPADRFATAAEFVHALAHGTGRSGAHPARSGTRPAPRWRRALPWGIAAAATAAAAWAFASRTAPAEASWSYVSFADSVPVTLRGPALGVSPDGRTIAYKDDRQNGMIWIKRSGALDPIPVPGTVRGFSPVFSPDGRWIAFSADGQVRKVPVDGGPTVTLADSVGAQTYNITWLADGSIVFTSPTGDELRRISPAGAVTVALREAAFRGLGLVNLTPLPKASGVLFTVCTSGCVTSALYALDFRSGKTTLLLNDVLQGWYLPGGHLLFARRDGAVLAAPFDLSRLQVTGAPAPVLDRVANNAANVMLAWSPSGTLVYLRAAAQQGEQEVVRVGRDGVAVPVDTTWVGVFNSMTLSPDGRRLAVGAGFGSGALSIWVKQLDRGPFSRLTFGGLDRRPAWSPDGQLIAFIRDSGAGGNVMVHNADGSGSDRVLAHYDRQLQEVTWSPDGQWIVGRTDNSTAGAGDLVAIPVDARGRPVPVASTPFTEINPAVSPDGHWLAYVSNETGTQEVYIKAFPDSTAPEHQISSHGGTAPRWSPDGRTIYFITGSGREAGVTVTTRPSLDVRDERQFFDVGAYTIDAFHQSYEVTPDGKSFLYVRSRQRNPVAAGPQAVVAQNWFADLRDRLQR